MIERIKENKEVLMYLIFGVLTTVVNIVVYFVCNDVLHINYLMANGAAWFGSVLFAYVTNRKFVFLSNSESLLNEFLRFLGSRVSTGIIDMAVMWVLVDIVSCNSMVSKVISNVLVIILNYVFSKLFVFQKEGK